MLSLFDHRTFPDTMKECSLVFLAFKTDIWDVWVKPISLFRCDLSTHYAVVLDQLKSSIDSGL